MKKVIILSVLLLFFMTGLAFARAEGNTQVTVSTSTAVEILAEGDFVEFIEINNVGSYAVYKGTSSGVTTSTGHKIGVGVALEYENWDDPIYLIGITGAGSVSLDVKDKGR